MNSDPLSERVLGIMNSDAPGLQSEYNTTLTKTFQVVLQE